MSKRGVLVRGDKIGIVAPGAQFNLKKFKTGIAILKSWGLVPVFDKNLFKKDFIYAGTVEQRVADIKKFMNQKDIKALWCVRGGYGTSAVAQELSKFKAKGRPKILIGLSDITALHLVFNQKYKWATIHGPTVDRMGIELQPQRESFAVYQTLFDPEFKLDLKTGLQNMGAKKNIKAPLIGGNLSLVCASLGSSYEIVTKGKVLFLEEIAEPTYRVDRMLTQLRNAGKFEGLKALVFGDFTNCERWKEVLLRNFKNSPFPVITGVKSGHGPLRLPLPLGSMISVQGKKTPRVTAL